MTAEKKLKDLMIPLLGVQQSLKRLNKIEDPVTRYSVLLNLFGVISDIGFSVVKGDILDTDDPELMKLTDNCKKTLDETQSELNTYIDNFNNWIQLGNLDPDRFLGRKMLNEASEDFKKNSEKR